MSDRRITIVVVGEDEFTPTLENLNRELGQVERHTQAVSQETGGLMGNYRQMTSVVSNLVAAYAAFEGVSQLNELGQQVNMATATFEAMSGGELQAAADMEVLRASTRGAVDDMTLMTNASLSLNAGLADSVETVAEMQNVAITLGRAFGGMGAEEALENFNMMLLNTSYQRLDSLGMSATVARQRVAELTATGMEMQEAFSQAVLEQGVAAVENLGEAAELTATSFDRVRTGVENAMQGVAVAVANVLEAAAEGLVAIGEGITAVSEAQQGLATEAEQEAAQVAEAWQAALNMQGLGQQEQGGITVSAEGLAHMERVLALIQEGVGLSEAWTIAWGDYRTAYRLATDEWLGYLEIFREAYADFESVTERRLAAEEEIAHQMALQTREANAVALAEQEAAAERTEAQAEARQAAAEFQASGGIFVEGGLHEVDLRLWMRDGVEFAEALQEAQAEAGELADKLTLAENAAKGVADEASAIADNIDDATNSVTSLFEAFGQSPGGMMAEMTDDVVALLEAAGAAESVIAGIQQRGDMESGRETAASQAYEQEILPVLAAVAEQHGEEAWARASEALRDYMATAETVTREGMMAAIEGAGVVVMDGATEAARTITVEAGDTASELAAELGMTVDEILAAAGVEDARDLQPGEYDVGETPMVGFDWMADIAAAAGLGGDFDPGKGFQEEMIEGAESFVVVVTEGTRAVFTEIMANVPGWVEATSGEEGGASKWDEERLVGTGEWEQTGWESTGGPTGLENRSFGIEQSDFETMIAGLSEVTTQTEELRKSMDDVKGKGQEFAASFETAGGHLKQVEADLRGIAGGSWETTLTVNVEVNDPSGGLGGDTSGLADAIEDIARGNGGQLPGVTNR